MVTVTHLDEREGVVFLHETLNAAANLLQTDLVLADPGDVLLNYRPTDVPVSVTALLQPADVLVHFGPDVIAQCSQAVLTVVHAFLGHDGEEEEKSKTANQNISHVENYLNRLLAGGSVAQYPERRH